MEIQKVISLKHEKPAFLQKINRDIRLKIQNLIRENELDLQVSGDLV
jgi:hypothetical protein